MGYERWAGQDVASIVDTCTLMPLLMTGAMQECRVVSHNTPEHPLVVERQLAPSCLNTSRCFCARCDSESWAK